MALNTDVIDRYNETPDDHDTRCLFSALRAIAGTDHEERGAHFESLFWIAHDGPRALRARARAALAEHGYRWGGPPVAHDPDLAGILADLVADGVL